MSCDNKAVIVDKTTHGLAPKDQATLWEHIVLDKASGKQMMLFDLDIEHKRFQANKSQKKHKQQKKRKMSALDSATTFAFRERQRAYSAPVPGSTPTDANIETQTNGGSSKPPQAFLATLEPISSQSTSFTTSFDSVTLDSSHNITFGTYQLLDLSPETLRDDAERQETLVKGRPTEGLTMKRRMLAEEGLSVSDEQLTMSGALDRGDVRCEVCAARERAMGGLEEAEIVAL